MTNPGVSRLHVFTGHRDCVYTLQAAREDHLFFSGGGDGMLVKWSLETPDEGELIAQLPNSIYSIAHHPDKEILIVGHNYEGIHLVDWKRKKEIGSLKLTEAAIFDLQPWTNRLYVASGDGCVTLVDLDTLQVKKRVKYSDKNVRTIAVNRERGELAVGYSDNFIRILDADDLSLKNQWQGHQNSVFALRFGAGDILYSTSRDARLKGWMAEEGYNQAFEVIAHMYAINYLDFSPDGKHFVTCSMDKSIKVWDTAEVKLLKVIDKARHAGHATSVNRVLWTRFHNRIVSASDDRTIYAWDLDFLN